MNWFRRLAQRAIVRIYPELREALQNSNWNVRRLAEDVAMYRQRDRDQSDMARILGDELKEAHSMFGPTPWAATGGSGLVRESKTGLNVAVKERIADLELALEDRGWLRELSFGNQQFSRWGIQMIILICRLYRIKNPIIQRGILVSSFYVFGRGFEVSSDDKATNDVIERFFGDARNQRELSVLALMERECDTYTDGNVFFALFTDTSNGEVVVRTIDSLEIQHIVSDPNDSSIPMFYKRSWSEQGFDIGSGIVNTVQRNAWYVDIDYKGTVPAQIGREEVFRGENGETVRILHRKDGALPKWQYGCPRAYAAIDWARAYRQRLEDYASIARSLARFAWDVKTKGGAPAIAGLKQTFATTLANDGTQIETNPPPVTGSAFISSESTTVNPVKTAGVQASPEEGRRLALMAYMVFGLPETFWGDVSVGTLATAKSLDRPTELKFIGDQMKWTVILKRLASYAVEQSGTRANGKLREARAKQQTDSEDTSTEASRDIVVKWPAIVEGDIPETVASIIDSITLKGGGQGIDMKTGIGLLLVQLGVEQPEKILDAMFPPDSYDMERSPESIDPTLEAEPDPAKVAEAVAELQKWMDRKRAMRG